MTDEQFQVAEILAFIAGAVLVFALVVWPAAVGLYRAYRWRRARKIINAEIQRRGW